MLALIAKTCQWRKKVEFFFAPLNSQQFFRADHDGDVEFHRLHIIIGVGLSVVGDGETLVAQVGDEAKDITLASTQAGSELLGSAGSAGADKVVNLLEQKKVVEDFDFHDESGLCEKVFRFPIPTGF